MIHLRLDELLHIADRVLDEVLIRDAGLLESALARPQTVLFGTDTYPSLAERAAALTHSLARNHALVDGNKRLALASLLAYLGLNQTRLTMTEDEAYDFIISIASGELDEVEEIAAVLSPHLSADGPID